MLIAHGETDVGRHRKLNEDSILAADGLFVVCDGMGGHQAGEVASSLAVDAIARFVQRSAEDRELTWPFGFDPRRSREANRLRTAVKLANRAVFDHGASASGYAGMGTTVAAILAAAGEPRVAYAHVGDSRIYLLRGERIVQLTRDDAWVDLDWASPNDPAGARSVLTKALGGGADVEFEVVDRTLGDGDVLLVCSDGLTGMVPDAHILEIVARHRDDLAGACRALVAAANSAGGRDNVSAILLQYRP